MDIEQTKLNESWSSISGSPQILKEISDFLKVERPGAFFEPAVKSGFASPYHYFTKLHNGKLLVLNGHLALLGRFGIQEVQTDSEFTEEDFDEFMDSIKSKLPYEPRDFQLLAARESIATGKQINRMCTGCLDADSEIEIICDDYTYSELKEILGAY